MPFPFSFVVKKIGSSILSLQTSLTNKTKPFKLHVKQLWFKVGLDNLDLLFVW